MNETQVILNEQESELLRSLVRQTGKAEWEIVRETLGLLTDRLAALRQARGMWKDRDDLPTLRELRAEMDRAVAVEWIRK